MKYKASIALVLIFLISTTTLAFAQQNTPESNISPDLSSKGTFYISQWTGSAWEEQCQQEFPVDYSTEEFGLDAVDGSVTLRIVQRNMPYADIDQIKLAACGAELTPIYAQYTADGQDVLADILKIDRNVIVVHEQEVEISWKIPAGCDEATLYLTANEYGDGFPFEHPWHSYLSYEMGSNPGSIVVDGCINETDGAIPFSSPYWEPTSGHPDGYTYIYISDDDENVYFTLDVTSDNTCEVGKDWAEIAVLAPDGTEQVFRIDDFDDTWGQWTFGITSKVSYKHKSCEFAIPKAIVGDDDIEFKLRYYGTVSISSFIIVEKQTIPYSSDQTFEFSTDFSPNFFLTDDQNYTSVPLAAGTYSVSEINIPAGWTLLSAICSDGSFPNAIGLQPAETVTCTFTNTGPPVGKSVDSGGTEKYVYSPGDTVYVTGMGFSTIDDVDIYIVADRAWTPGDPIPPDITDDGVNTVPANGTGNIPPTQVWAPPLPVGEYDIVFDGGDMGYPPDGVYDDPMAMADRDFVDHPNHPGFIVVEQAYGGGPTVGGQLMLINKAALVAQWIELPIRLMLGLAL